MLIRESMIGWCHHRWLSLQVEFYQGPLCIGFLVRGTFPISVSAMNAIDRYFLLFLAPLKVLLARRIRNCLKVTWRRCLILTMLRIKL